MMDGRATGKRNRRTHVAALAALIAGLCAACLVTESQLPKPEYTSLLSYCVPCGVLADHKPYYCLGFPDHNQGGYQ